MKPDDIYIRNISSQFQYEKMAREVDACDDMDDLKEMCKFLIKLEMKTRENYSVMIQDMMPDMSASPHNNS